MSTLNYHVRLGEEPSPEDLVRMKATRGMMTALTGILAEQQSGGLSSSTSRREWYCSVQAERIPHQWLDDAGVLVKHHLIDAVEWLGEIEESPSASQAGRIHELKHMVQSLLDLLDRPTIAGESFAAINSYSHVLKQKASALLDEESQ